MASHSLLLAFLMGMVVAPSMLFSCGPGVAQKLLQRPSSPCSARAETALRCVVPCCAIVGVESPEMRRKILEERDRAAVEEPTAEEALAAATVPVGHEVREAFERSQAAWKGRLPSFWRMNDGC